MKRLILAVILLLVSSQFLSARGSNSDKVVYIAELKDVIDRGVADYIKRSLQVAEPNPVILILDTQGGYLTPLGDIIRALKEYPGLLIVWIPSGGKAGSAGVFIALAADKLYVSKSAVIGAAQPRPADPKVVNFTAAWIKALAEDKFSSEDPRVTISEEFVTKNRALTGEEAIKLGIADGRAEYLKDILESEGLIEYEVLELKPGFIEEFLSLVGDPTIAVFLIVIGVLAIYIEVAITGFQGLVVVGFLSITAGIYGLGMLGLNILILAILPAGVIFLVAELVYPGLQVFGVLGILLMIIAIYTAYWQQPYIDFTPYSMVMIILLVFVSTVLIYSGLEVGKILKLPTPSLRESLIGKRGIAKTMVTPRRRGVVLVEGEEWTAYSIDEDIHEDEEIVVVDMKGLTLIVRKISE